MTTWVNYKEIKARVTMGQVLEHYGVLGNLHEKGDELIGCCPIHRGSNTNQFHASRTKNNFMCFGNCHGGGNVIDFVVMMEGGDKEKGNDVRSAAIKMQEWFGLTFERPRGERRTADAVPATAAASATTSVAAEEQTLAPQTPLPVSQTTEETTPETVTINPPLKFALKSLDGAHPYLTERGLTAETIAHFGVGLCTGKGIMAGRIAIPIHNEQGELVAYAGRWPGEPPDGEGKYKLPAGFHKSHVVYNLHRAKELAKEKGLIVVEGFFDCMRLHQAGVFNVVALMGSSLSEEQEELLLDAVGPNGKIALMFDEDDAGRHGRDGMWKEGDLKPGALQRLAAKVYVRVVGLGGEGTQPDGLHPDHIKILLS